MAAGKWLAATMRSKGKRKAVTWCAEAEGTAGSPAMVRQAFQAVSDGPLTFGAGYE